MMEEVDIDDGVVVGEGEEPPNLLREAGNLAGDDGQPVEDFIDPVIN